VRAVRSRDHAHVDGSEGSILLEPVSPGRSSRDERLTVERMTNPYWKQPPRYDQAPPEEGLEPLPPVDPVLLGDHSIRIAMHEAAHATANYLLGRKLGPVKIARLAGRTWVKPTDDPFVQSVCLLAGEAFERSIGQPRLGSAKDLDQAETVLAKRFSGSALTEACKVVEEAAIELVGSERFQKLTFALGDAIAKRKQLSGAEVQEILEEADGRERHSVDAPRVAPWYKVYARVGGHVGQLLYHGSSEAEAERIAATCDSLKIGSIYS
jgi:hypothetical protein